MKNYVLNGLVGACLLLTGCATQLATTAPAKTFLPVSQNQVLKVNESNGLKITIHSVVGPSDPVSLTPYATWNEVPFTISNASGREVTIEKIQAVDSRGVFLDQVGLEEPYRATAERMKTTTAANEARMNPISQVGTSLLGTAAGMLIPGANLLVAGIGIAQGAQQYTAETAGRHEIDGVIAEFKNRQVTRVALDQGGTVSGSAFFPARPTREIRITCVQNGETKEIVVRLNSSPAPATSEEVASIAPQREGAVTATARTRTEGGYKQVLK